MFYITEDWIKSWQSGNGGWNREQLTCINVAWPPRQGWIQRCTGKPISFEAKERFENLMGMTAAKTRAAKKHFRKVAVATPKAEF